MALDFPNSPADGQIYDNYYWDAEQGVWNSLGNYDIPNLLSNGIFTSSGSSITPLTVKGAPSQAASLQEWKNSSDTTLASLSASGGLTLNNALTVPNGGTGTNSLTNGGYLKGSGTGAVTSQSGIPAGDITSGTLDLARGGTGGTTGAGLVPMIPTSVSVSSGSGSVGASGAVTFTGANTVRIDGCFTSDYTNYRIIFVQSSASTTAADGFIRLRASGTDLTTGYYYNGTVIDNSTVQGNSSLGTTQWFVYTTHPSPGTSGHSSFVLDIFQPQKSTTPQTFKNHASVWTGNARQVINGGFNNAVASYDGFTMFLGASQTFGGTFTVYGYKI